ncbi:MAG: hypothetical protein ACI9W4_002693 [Rhodothermales bacterium]|jgi:hypothetical protein
MSTICIPIPDLHKQIGPPDGEMVPITFRREAASAMFGATEGDWSGALGQVLCTSMDDATYSLSMATVAMHAIRAARANPIRSLRYE